MKFINHLETITGISIYPFLSLMIFFLFFTGVILFAFSMRKEAIEEIKNIPLQKNTEDGEAEIY